MVFSSIELVDLVELVYYPAYNRPSQCRGALDAYTRVIYGNVVELFVGNSYSYLKVNGMWISDTDFRRRWPRRSIRLYHIPLGAYQQFYEAK